MARLQTACERLGLDMPPEVLILRDLESAIAQTAIDTRFATAKLLLTAGLAERGYRRPIATRIEVYILMTTSKAPARSAYEQGVAVRLCDTRVSIQPRLAGVKSLNRLDQVLARQEWPPGRIWEGLMLDVEDYLICGTMTNVFLIRDNRLMTPRLDRAGVAGVMRQHLLNLLKEKGIACSEQRLVGDDLYEADEVFLTNSQVGALPVAQIDDRTLSVGHATRRVQAMLAANDVPECQP